MEEKIYFPTTDDLTLCGILETPKKETDKCILMCHGFSVDKDENGIYVDLSHELVERGYAVFRFDFRAHGESDGDTRDLSVVGEVSDIAAAVVYIESQGYTQIGLVAMSFGAGPALLYAGSRPSFFSGIMIWNGLVVYEGLLNEQRTVSQWAKNFWGSQALSSIEQKGYADINGYIIGKAFFEDIKRLNPWQELDKITSPVLFIHGTEDTVVPYEEIIKVTKMFGNTLVTIDGAAHDLSTNYTHELQATHATTDFLENLWKI